MLYFALYLVPSIVARYSQKGLACVRPTSNGMVKRQIVNIEIPKEYKAIGPGYEAHFGGSILSLEAKSWLVPFLNGIKW